MFATVGGYIREARTLLLDRKVPYRYSTRSLVRALNLTLLEARRVRPDLFIQFIDSTPQYYFVDDPDDQDDPEDGDGDNDENLFDEYVPIEEPFRLAILSGIVGHAIARDQDDVQDRRASGFMDTFYYMLTGARGSPDLRGEASP